MAPHTSRFCSGSLQTPSKMLTAQTIPCEILRPKNPSFARCPGGNVCSSCASNDPDALQSVDPKMSAPLSPDSRQSGSDESSFPDLEVCYTPTPLPPSPSLSSLPPNESFSLPFDGGVSCYAADQNRYLFLTRFENFFLGEERKKANIFEFIMKQFSPVSVFSFPFSRPTKFLVFISQVTLPGKGEYSTVDAKGRVKSANLLIMSTFCFLK